MPAGIPNPAAASLSAHLGIIPVAENLPRTFPLGPIPFFSNRKMSCMLITSENAPVSSVMWVIRREPSLIREA